MASLIQGYVFNDILSNGSYEPTDPGIPNAYIVLLDPDGICTNVQTDASGLYEFSGLTIPGSYTIYETVDMPLACPPVNFSQPPGFTSSTTIRKADITITQQDIDTSMTFTGVNFGHDNPELFGCSPLGYVVTLPDLTGNSLFYSINPVTGELSLINDDMGVILNAIGYSVSSNLIYGIEFFTSNLIRVAADGTTVNLGPVPNLPVPVVLPDDAYYIGDVDENDHLYISGLGDIYYVVDVDQDSLTYGQLLDPLNGFSLDTAPYGTPYAQFNQGDWAYNVNDGLLYGIDYLSMPNNLTTLNPLTGDVNVIPTTGIEPVGNIFGSVFIDADGIFYGIQNNTGTIFRITVENGTATAEPFTGSIPTKRADAAICLNSSINVDFGDAPDTSLGNGYGNYSTLLASNGPRHLIINELYLGSQVTGEMDAYQNTVATGDDILEGLQDDGVEMPLPPLYQCQHEYSISVSFTNNTGGPANLYGWVDFNGDGIFQENEAADVQVVQPGSGLQQTVLNFTVPSDVIPPLFYTFARIRLTTDELIDTNTIQGGADTRSLGPASDGEVEDYYIEVKCCNNPWKQSNITDRIKVPCSQPCISRIVFNHESISISSFYIIRTPVTDFNPEGKISTGYEAIVKGILSVAIAYADCSCNGQLHSLHQDIRFYSSMALECYNPGDCLDINAYIEDISYLKISKCEIQVNALIAVGAEIHRPSVPKP